MEEIGERIFWLPYSLRKLAYMAGRSSTSHRVQWKRLLDQIKQLQVSKPGEKKVRWQESLETVHRMWVDSVDDAESLLSPWADLCWFSSFNLQAVQAVYGIAEEVAVDRLRALLDYGLVHQVVEEGLDGPRYRWEPLVWAYINQRMRSGEASTAWIDRYNGGWGQGPLWRVSVPGRSIFGLQIWHPRWWRVDV